MLKMNNAHQTPSNRLNGVSVCVPPKVKGAFLSSPQATQAQDIGDYSRRVLVKLQDSEDEEEESQ